MSSLRAPSSALAATAWAASTAACACCALAATSGLSSSNSTCPALTRSPSRTESFASRALILAETLAVSASAMPCSCTGGVRKASHSPTATSTSNASPPPQSSARRRGGGGDGSESSASLIVDPLVRPAAEFLVPVHLPADFEQLSQRNVVLVGGLCALDARAAELQAGVDHVQ